MVNREVVGAHYGLRGWLAQRITAVIMALYTFLLVGAVIATPNVDYQSWRAIFAPAWMKLATLFFLLSLFPHIWVGVRNIFMDYVSNSALRLSAYLLAILWLIACAAWCVRLLWSV